MAKCRPKALTGSVAKGLRALVMSASRPCMSKIWGSQVAKPMRLKSGGWSIAALRLCHSAIQWINRICGEFKMN